MKQDRAAGRAGMGWVAPRRAWGSALSATWARARRGSLLVALGLGLGTGLTAPPARAQEAQAQEAQAQQARAQDLPTPTGPVLLTVTGKIARTNQNDAALFDEAMLLALPRHRIETSTPWTDGRKIFEGVRLEDVLDEVGAGAAVTLKARALNDYSIDIPASDAREFDMLLALRMDGKPLSRRDKGPIWIVYPRDSVPKVQDERYDSRWVWQLNGLDVR